MDLNPSNQTMASQLAGTVDTSGFAYFYISYGYELLEQKFIFKDLT